MVKQIESDFQLTWGSAGRESASPSISVGRETSILVAAPTQGRQNVIKSEAELQSLLGSQRLACWTELSQINPWVLL